MKCLLPGLNAVIVSCVCEAVIVVIVIVFTTRRRCKTQATPAVNMQLVITILYYDILSVVLVPRRVAAGFISSHSLNKWNILSWKYLVHLIKSLTSHQMGSRSSSTQSRTQTQ